MKITLRPALTPVMKQRLWSISINLLLVGVVVLMGTEPAHAGLADYLSQLVTKTIPTSSTFSAVAMGGGGVGALASGWKFYQGMHDGGQLGDNIGSATALGVTSLLFGYGSLTSALGS